jgi:peroxisomal enoyl-CoA hydratase 2
MQVDVKKAVGFQSKPQKVTYNSRDLMLYALSIGVRSPETELHFLYENHPNFAAHPTYPIVLGFKRDNLGVSIFDAGSTGEEIPGIPSFDPNMVVHGSQSLEIFRTLPVEGGDYFELHDTVTGVYDKGSGMVIEKTTLMVDPKEVDRPYSKMIMSGFVRGAGGWGGPKGPKPELYEPPKDKEPDFISEEKTTEEQAILYRLSG